MDEVRFLSVDEVVAIQKSTLPNSGNPDSGKLEGALFRIQTLRDYEGCQDIFTFAAMYMVAIAKSHAFNDANKRTAFQAASVFLLLNGHELNTSLELVKLTIFAATGEAELGDVSFALKILSDYRNDLLSDTVSAYA
ncbi:type II toxin-antitoxin system death-on-curing family toxin [Serratia bockelmannii]|uniref:type II toxin-antitoxin system death-on-curing family toxin n=1 Tax=Serratia TaxID=613 RepID=UPI0018D657F8|nr:type II toxin-antitoxin system death-on-curing family toxin [Serratia bockelmannii]MBH2952453.1 type II toxin-antitoxin system death-on-curing family toxin [Serratia marcescens]MCW7646181.1 type II toxin-antitoxin system death-on-curing family toxin [Serratia bockelmannii]MCW7655966.1 type II toxin-antitoxin system death-on-curing family toxin [Serratia bockelmannii]MCW7675751.1 type II toxin-antitoxin system death-on-curing family toxin [Serratia bockelmannii]MCW7680529.1 type II toxin-ant